MCRVRRRQQFAARAIAATLLLGAAAQASAQESTDPPPPQPDTTTIDEPVAGEDAPSVDQPPREPVEEGPAHVPPNASGIDLTTLETKNLSLLYFDPIQTYLTPYIARSFENALGFHKRKFNWTPW